MVHEAAFWSLVDSYVSKYRIICSEFCVSSHTTLPLERFWLRLLSYQTNITRSDALVADVLYATMSYQAAEFTEQHMKFVHVDNIIGFFFFWNPSDGSSRIVIYPILHFNQFLSPWSSLWTFFALETKNPCSARFMFSQFHSPFWRWKLNVLLWTWPRENIYWKALTLLSQSQVPITHKHKYACTIITHAYSITEHISKMIRS